MTRSRHAKTLWTIPFLIAACLIGLPANAQYSGGSGTADDPYRIATAADLIALGEDPNDYDKHFILTADIDLDPNLPGRKVFDRAVIAPDTKPGSGFQSTPFTGVFDGNGHTIWHLTIHGASCVGLFGLLGDYRVAGKVTNLGLEAVEISATGYWVGGLAGLNRSSIANCYSTGEVTGGTYVGGLAGGNRATVSASHSTGVVKGTECAGGLVGSNEDSEGNDASITDCYSSGPVNGTHQYVGGLVGLNHYGSITTSYSSGSVNGTESVGGLVGCNDYGSIANCYSTGVVSGTSYYVGGLVGYSSWDSSITTSYSTGAVSGDSGAGGLVGSASLGFVSACVWDTQTSGQTGSDGGVGLTTTEMMDPYTLGLNGFANDPNWVLDAGRDYPRLAWEGTAGTMIPEAEIDWLEGQGTAEAPYRIDTVEQLIFLGRAASALWDRHFILGADIDLDPALPGRMIFGQAVIPSFSGAFDGGGHVISNLIIEGGSYVGLFGYLAADAEVRNLGVVGVNVASAGYGVGGLVGRSYGSITNCYSIGSVSGHSSVGGLVASNYGSITTSYSSGSASGDSSVGGLVGDSHGGIVSSYSTCSVSGTDRVGGLVGHNGGLTSGVGRITSCYSSGSVSGTDEYVGGLVGFGAFSSVVVRVSFWDTQTSGQTESAGGTGKTTAEMQTAKTFLDAGWDFVGETANGTEDIWWILEGQDYPRLWWELDN